MARIVATIVGNQALFGEWKEEMETMAERLKAAWSYFFKRQGCKGLVVHS
jgi:aspartate/tyrosine/aromatic aminotransferase